MHSIFEHDLNYFQKQTKINIDINCNPALPSLPSHNKREQYSVLRQPNNQIPQCALALKKKKNCLDVKSLHFPLVYLFLLLSALFPVTIPHLSFYLLLIAILFYYHYSCTYNLFFSSALRGRWRLTDQDLRNTNTLPYNRPTVSFSAFLSNSSRPIL